MKFKSLLLFVLGITSTATYASQSNIEKSIVCSIDVEVTASQNFENPVKRYTSLKNDGYPMLLIGIKINNAFAIKASKTIKLHQHYCLKLIGQQKDAYLSGLYNQNESSIQVGARLRLINIHSSGKNYPYWSDFYFLEKRD